MYGTPQHGGISMQKQFFLVCKYVLLLLLCVGIMTGCDDDDDNGDNIAITSAIDQPDPKRGFIMNSLDYMVVIDIDEKEKFRMSLSPGMIVELKLQEKKTHVLHAVVLNTQGRTIHEFVNSFYIDEFPLDNQFKDFVCSWYVELVSEYGFGNDMGS